MCVIAQAGRDIEVTVAAAAAHFASEQSDEGEARPLSKAEGIEDLLFGVLDGGIDGVNGGVGHWHLWNAKWRLQRKYSEAGESSIDLRVGRAREGRDDREAGFLA